MLVSSSKRSNSSSIVLAMSFFCLNRVDRKSSLISCVLMKDSVRPSNSISPAGFAACRPDTPDESWRFLLPFGAPPVQTRAASGQKECSLTTPASLGHEKAGADSTARLPHIRSAEQRRSVRVGREQPRTLPDELFWRCCSGYEPINPWDMHANSQHDPLRRNHRNNTPRQISGIRPPSW